MHDVLVIGAGPAGSQVAKRLTELGHRVLVLEEHQRVGEPACCTGLLGRECIKDYPIPSHLILADASSARFYTPSGQSFQLQKSPVQAYIVDRVALDRSLAEQAQQAGAEYVLSSPVQDLRLRDDGVAATVGLNGQVKTFTARAAILACGPGNHLPQKLGLGEIGDWVVGAQAEVERDGLAEIEIYMGQKIAPGFFAWLVPTAPGRAWAGLLSRKRPGDHLRQFLAKLHAEGKILSPQAHISYGLVPLQPRPRSYGERILAVGDAAGQVKPTTAGGIYYSLLSADMAAQTLHRALCSNDFSPGHLSQYQREWKKRLGHELQVGYWARRFYEKLGDPQIEEIVQHIRSSGFLQSVLQAEDFSFDWHSITIVKAMGRQALPLFLRAMARSILPFKERG